MKGISTTFIQYIVVFDLLNESKLSPWALVLTYDHFTQKTPPKERVKEFGSQGAVLFDPVYNKDVKNRMREERSKDLKDFLEVTKDTAYDWLVAGTSLTPNHTSCLRNKSLLLCLCIFVYCYMYPNI